MSLSFELVKAIAMPTGFVKAALDLCERWGVEPIYHSGNLEYASTIQALAVFVISQGESSELEQGKKESSNDQSR